MASQIYGSCILTKNNLAPQYTTEMRDCVKIRMKELSIPLILPKLKQADPQTMRSHLTTLRFVRSLKLVTHLGTPTLTLHSLRGDSNQILTGSREITQAVMPKMTSKLDHPLEGLKREFNSIFSFLFFQPSPSCYPTFIRI